MAEQQAAGPPPGRGQAGSDEELRAEFWETLLEALGKCQVAIDLLEQLDRGTNSYIAEWEELDGAFAHMHNVRRWVGRAWRMGQEQRPTPEVSVTQTARFTSEDIKRVLNERKGG